MPDKMMDEFDRWAMRLLKFLAAVILLVVYLLLLGAWISPAPPRHVVVQLSAAEKRWINERFAFHGITSSVFDPATGERYFIRDGVRCKL